MGHWRQRGQNPLSFLRMVIHSIRLSLGQHQQGKSGVQIDGQNECPYEKKSESFVTFRASAQNDTNQVGPIDWENLPISEL